MFFPDLGLLIAEFINFCWVYCAALESLSPIKFDFCLTLNGGQALLVFTIFFIICCVKLHEFIASGAGLVYFYGYATDFKVF